MQLTNEGTPFKYIIFLQLIELVNSLCYSPAQKALLH